MASLSHAVCPVSLWFLLHWLWAWLNDLVNGMLHTENTELCVTELALSCSSAFIIESAWDSLMDPETHRIELSPPSWPTETLDMWESPAEFSKAAYSIQSRPLTNSWALPSTAQMNIIPSQWKGWWVKILIFVYSWGFVGFCYVVLSWQ